jgi:hypothetical protein
MKAIHVYKSPYKALSMVSLRAQKDFQKLQRLSFCYLCGDSFAEGDKKNHDHVPPENIFDKKDREPLKLPTHYNCNHAHRLTDEKIGEMIRLRRRQFPQRKNRRLKVTFNINTGVSFLTNLDIDAAVWRWVRGFHAALYQSHLPEDDPSKAKFRDGAIQTPFRKTRKTDQGGTLVPILPQHRLFVEIIKANRAMNNVDGIVTNKGQMAYECVWQKADADDGWICIFALNVCDWKDLGAVAGLEQCGCAGYYRLLLGNKPQQSSTARKPSLIIPNLDPLDPFGR